MNIYDYLKEYGDYSFQEKKFNEVDAVILSFISYVDYSKMFDEKKQITIEEAGRKHLAINNQSDKNIIATKESNQLLKVLKDTNRFKNCILSNYEYIGNDVLQFGVISIEYEPNKVYVSFEGTDSLFSSWREDFLLGGYFPTKTHKLAIKYVNKHFTFSNKKIILGGHSKGGNLALVSGMYSNRLVRHKITKIYSADGPGLLDKEYKSRRYQNTKKKYIHIIPDCSIVGILLNHSGDKVINATKKGLIAHNISNWEIEDNHFKKATLKQLSKEIDKRLMQWIRKTSTEDKREIIDNIYSILLEANVKSIVELKENKTKILDIIRKSNITNQKTKEKLKELFYIVIKSIGSTTKEEIKNSLTNLIKLRMKNGTK